MKSILKGDKMSSVSLVRAERSPLDSLERSISNSLDLIGFSFSKSMQNIVIKPNLCYYLDYSTGHTTDPVFMAALINLIRHKLSSDVKISIIESDASAMKCKYAYNMLGYNKLAEEYDVPLINLAEEPNDPVNLTVNGCDFALSVPKIIKDADLRINIPKIKYMSQTGISCALKNLYGCNPIVKKYKFHAHLPEAIVALNKIMKFDLHILDGLIVSGNIPKRLGLVMASQDPVAFDTLAATIAGLNPSKLKQLTLGQKEKIGTMAYVTKGEDPMSFARQYPKPTMSVKILTTGYKFAIKTGLLSTDFQ